MDRFRIKHWTSVAWDIALEVHNLSEQAINLMDTQQAQEELLPELSNQIFEAISTGQIVALNSSGHPLKDATNAPELLIKSAHVHPGSVNAWLKSKGHWYVWNPDFTAPEAKRTELQEQTVLKQLRDLGYDPKQLPPRQGSAPWVKSHIRKALTKNYLFTDSSFIKTWERLRSSGEIAEALS